MRSLAAADWLSMLAAERIIFSEIRPMTPVLWALVSGFNIKPIHSVVDMVKPVTRRMRTLLHSMWETHILRRWRPSLQVAEARYYFYIVKWDVQRYTLSFLFLLENIDCGYFLELPRWGGSNEYLQPMFWAEKWKISEFLSEDYSFFVFVFFCSEIFNTFEQACFRNGRFWSDWGGGSDDSLGVDCPKIRFLTLRKCFNVLTLIFLWLPVTMFYLNAL